MKTARIFFVSAILLSCLCCSKNSSPLGNCEEKPNDGRVCTLAYMPVCGCNNKTYGNACVAASHGITRYTEGECKKATTSTL